MPINRQAYEIILLVNEDQQEGHDRTKPGEFDEAASRPRGPRTGMTHPHVRHASQFVMPERINTLLVVWTRPDVVAARRRAAAQRSAVIAQGHNKDVCHWESVRKAYGSHASSE